MSREYLKLYVDLENGEGGLTDGSRKGLEALIKSDNLLALDILQDCIGDLTKLYDAAFKDFHEGLGKLRKRRA